MGWFCQPIVFRAKLHFYDLKKDGFKVIGGGLGLAGNTDFGH